MDGTRRVVALTIFVALALSMLVSSSAAADSADPSPPAPSCPTCDGEGDVGNGVISARVEIFVNGEAVPGRPGQVVDNPYAHCTFTLYAEGETVSLHPIADAWHVTFEDRAHWVVFCPPQVIAYTYFPEGDPPPPGVRDDLVAAAYRATPVVAFNPQSSPNGDDDIPHVTQLLAFLWVEDALWAPVTATAQLAGTGYSVTTTATPNETVWRGGDDPETVICDQGTPYQFGIGGDDVQDQSCTTTFEQSSAIKTHKLELTASWDVSYTCSWGCGTNPLPDLETNSEREVVVAEIQAIERS